jgi:tetratricopeptide (TPR) repeat protein
MVTPRILILAMGLQLVASTFADAQTSDGQVSVVLGDSLMTAGMTVNAIEAYRGGLEQHPDDAILLSKLSIALASRAQETPGRDGDEEILVESVNVASAAVRSDPDLSRAYTALSIAVGRYGQHLAHVHRIRRARQVIDLAKQAKAAVEYAVVLDPYDFAPHTILGVWHRELTIVHPAAKAVARLFLGGYPDVSLEESERFINRAVELAPDRVTVRMQLALTYLAMDDIDAALEEFRMAVELDPRSGYERLEQDGARELIEELERELE